MMITNDIYWPEVYLNLKMQQGYQKRSGLTENQDIWNPQH